jgi:hypothetical protein
MAPAPRFPLARPRAGRSVARQIGPRNRRHSERAARRPAAAPTPPPCERLTAEGVREFLDCMRWGYGPHLVCHLMGIKYRVYKRTFDEDEDFREEVLSAQRAWPEMLYAVAFELALGYREAGSCDRRALFFLLKREQRRQEFEATMEFERWKAELLARLPAGEREEAAECLKAVG